MPAISPLPPAFRFLMVALSMATSSDSAFLLAVFLISLTRDLLLAVAKGHGWKGGGGAVRVRVVQRCERLVGVVVRGRDVDEHERLRVAAEACSAVCSVQNYPRRSALASRCPA